MNILTHLACLCTDPISHDIKLARTEAQIRRETYLCDTVMQHLEQNDRHNPLSHTNQLSLVAMMFWPAIIFRVLNSAPNECLAAQITPHDASVTSAFH